MDGVNTGMRLKKENSAEVNLSKKGQGNCYCFLSRFVEAFCELFGFECYRKAHFDYVEIPDTQRAAIRGTRVQKYGMCLLETSVLHPTHISSMAL